MKKYIVLGDNNYWYATIECTPEVITQRLKNLETAIKNGDYTDEEPFEVSNLTAFCVENNSANLSIDWN